MALALTRPSLVGAVAPSSRHLARAMNAQVGMADALIELGAGTGAVTEALHRAAPARPLLAVELQPDLAAGLQRRLPTIEMACAPAHEVLAARRALAPAATVVWMMMILGFALTAAPASAPDTSPGLVAAIPAPTLDRTGGTLTLTGSVDALFASDSFLGTNKALKRDRARPSVAVAEFTSTFSGIRAQIASIRQQRPLGLGHAVWCARHLIGDEPFAVILPDDVVSADTPCLRQMVEVQAETGGSVIAAMEVAPEQAQAYGILDVMSGPGATAPVRGIVEKPRTGTAPSNLAVIGRYILQPTIFGHLSAQSRGSGGEIQLTDAIAAEIAAGGHVFAHRFSGMRFDCGSKQGFLQATVSYALANPELRDDFAQFLSGVLAQQKAAE